MMLHMNISGNSLVNWFSHDGDIFYNEYYSVYPNGDKQVAEKLYKIFALIKFHYATFPDRDSYFCAEKPSGLDGSENILAF
jgi:hypothetical protein